MKLHLVDGTSYIYRAYHAIRGLRNSKGLPTNAIYGFTNILFKIIKERNPEAIAIVFDSPEPTERHKLFKEYKAQRPPPPDDLKIQIDPIKEIVNALNISIFILPGYEADDILASISKKEALKGTEVYILTGDKDMLQVIDSNIRIYDPMKNVEYDSEYVRKRFGITPDKIPDIMALTGDSVDNIPGIKGIGEKTAKELIQRYSSTEGLIRNIHQIENERIRKLVFENIDSVELSKKLATINPNVPVPINREELAFQEPDWEKLKKLFIEFEFTTLLKLIPQNEPIMAAHETILTLERLKEMLSPPFTEISINIEPSGNNPLLQDIVGISCSMDGKMGYYIPIRHKIDSDQLNLNDVMEVFSPIFNNRKIAKIGHNLKLDMHILGRSSIDVKGHLFDTMIGSYLLNPNKPNQNLENISLDHLSYKKMDLNEILGSKKSFEELPVEKASLYASENAVLAMKLKENLFQRLKKEGLIELYNEMEMPLIYVLYEMERNGIRIDTRKLYEFSKELASQINSIENHIYILAGEKFNINSPKQLRKILFEKLMLIPGRKTKSGYSTDTGVLESLVNQHPLPEEILQHRTLTKIKNTYIDTLPEFINPETGRLHTSFNQTVTSTGRLSSSSPNLQNIPIRGQWGEKIRKAFITEDGNLLISADYSQIELRILAHFSKDTGLIEAFTQDIDIHAKTAIEIFGITNDEVTSEMRRIAKSVNFGIIYGISPYGLSETLKIPREEAKGYIETYFQRHEGVKAFIDETIKTTRDKGCAKTVMGRVRPIPEINSPDKNRRLQAERLAVNSPIQGSAADIIKMAMIRIHNKLKETDLKTKMILQIHDELLFEAPEEELKESIQLIQDGMEKAIILSVPLKVDVGFGRSWAEAH